MAYDEALVAATSNYFLNDGSAEMARLLDQGVVPDAVFCCNDTLAIGTLRTLFERGLRVPDDIAVVGVDDVDDGRYAIPKAGLAGMSIDRLVRRMDGDTSPATDFVVPRQLIVRESTVGLPSDFSERRGLQRRPRPATATMRQSVSVSASKRPSRAHARQQGSTAT